METNKIIEKYIKRIMVDYPEEDKIHLDLMQFANEIQQVKNFDIPAVIKSVCVRHSYEVKHKDVIPVKICKKCGHVK